LALLEKAIVHHSEGRVAEATPLYEEVIEITRELGNARQAAVALTNLSDTRLLAGDHAGAVPLLREAIEYLGQTGDMAYAPWANLVLGLALRKTGESAEARVVLDRGARWALEVASPEDMIFAAEAMADWLGAASASDDALVAWAAASRAREDLDMPRQPTDDVWINEGMERDTEALSKSAVSEAWAVAEDLDLREAVERTLQALAAVSLASPSTKPRDRFALTARESEVLGLLVRGSTDREIAEELFISPKTASVHVANIKGKLGASSRVDTVTRAVRMGITDLPDHSET
jgi:DNA-binding CsgD family transcriptional regulator